MSRLATARCSSQAGSLGVSRSTLELERRALPVAIDRPDDRERGWVAIVRMAVPVLAAEVIVRDVPRFSPRVQKRSVTILAVLQVQRDGRARPVAAVDVAAVDHAAMMKAHLALPERDDALERAVRVAD